MKVTASETGSAGGLCLFSLLSFYNQACEVILLGQSPPVHLHILPQLFANRLGRTRTMSRNTLEEQIRCKVNPVDIFGFTDAVAVEQQGASRRRAMVCSSMGRALNKPSGCPEDTCTSTIRPFASRRYGEGWAARAK